MKWKVIKSMEKNAKNFIQELLEKAGFLVQGISRNEGVLGVCLEVNLTDPHLFILREGEGLHALNHLVRRFLENREWGVEEGKSNTPSILVDMGGFHKKRIENIKNVAHMMAERARYFKSSMEVDPMPAFERRIVHEFLSTDIDLKTESVGEGRSRRVVIKYIGGI